MTRGLTKSKFSKVIACLVIAVMVFGLMPARYAYAAQDASGVDQEWYNFRNNQENNGVTDRKTPTSIDETAMKWGVKYGTGWGAAPTPPLLLNGKIYIGSGNKVLELDKETGEKLRESDAMAANVGYAMNPILYADGGLFVQVGNGIIQKIDLKTLQVAWQTPRVGGQTLCPISHVNIDGTGYIYTGTWNRENGDGRYMCFTTDDKNVEVDEQTGKKIKAATWQFVPSGSTKDTEKITYDEALNVTLEEENNVAKRGFYWAGCYATENYIAVGSDDGTNEGDYTATAVFYTLNPKTGEIIDRIDGIKGDIRTTTVYDNGYLYFATKGGQVHKVSVDEDGCLGQDSYIDLGGMITAAPLVYKNKIYMGVSGMGGQFDPDGGHGFAVLDNSKETLDTDSFLYKLAIPGYPQAAALLSNAYETEDFDGDGKPDGRVYLYFTYNANPGGIYYAYDEPDMTAEDAAKTSAELFIPSQDKQQYCISTICAGKDGTLYYKNDSCYLMAVETNPAYIKDIKVTADDKNAVSWNQKFHSRFTDYNLVAKDTAKSVDLEITAADGAAVTVDGKAYTGKTTVALNGAENKAVSVVAKKGGKQRTYTLNVRTVADIATLEELSVSISNTYGSMQIPLDPEFAKDVHDYEVNVSANNTSDWYRIWPKVSDPQSGIKVIAGENIANSNGGELITGEEMSPAGVNDKYYKGYLSDRTKDGVVKIEVTSENGKKTETYTLRLIRNFIHVENLTLNETAKSLAVDETFQLIANLEPENATNKAVTWSSLDDQVATVDENGLVTAVGEGKTSVSAVSVSGSKTATCEITVETPPVEDIKAKAKEELREYLAEKDLANYREAQQQELQSILADAEMAIDQAEDENDVDAVVQSAKTAMDKVKTAAQLDEEEAAEQVTLTVRGGNSDSGKPRLTWNKVPGASKYVIYRSGTSNGTYTKMFDTDGTSYTNTTAGAGYTYFYKVQALDKNGKVIATSSIVKQKCITTTSAVLTVKGGNSDSGKPRLTWNKVPGASKYVIYRSGTSTGTYKKMFDTDGTSYTNTSANGGYTYYYGVQAVDKNGKAIAKSNTVKQLCKLSKPKMTKGNNSAGKPKLTWNKVSGASKYVIYRSGYSNGTYKQMYTTTGTSYTNTSAGAGYTYFYKVVAVSKNNTNANATSQIVKQKCLSSGVKITKGNATSGKPKLSWKKVSGAKKYEVYRSGYKNGTYTKMYTTEGTSYTNTSAKKGYTYYYKVKAIGADTFVESNLVSVKCK